MSNVVNLNKFRKRKAKLEKERQAETNRRFHGRTKAERQREALQKQKLEQQVDGAKLGLPAATAAPEVTGPTESEPIPAPVEHEPKTPEHDPVPGSKPTPDSAEPAPKVPQP
jgi:hypothetical protein